MSHMAVSTLAELEPTLASVRLNPKWLQTPSPEHPRRRVHFDVSDGSRNMLVSLGAIEVTGREVVMLSSLLTMEWLRDHKAARGYFNKAQRKALYRRHRDFVKRYMKPRHVGILSDCKYYGKVAR